MDIIDRIKQYLNHKGISDYRFEKTLSLSKGYFFNSLFVCHQINSL